MARVVAIIQARMGSTRLPGKVMMDIAGKPMLQHIIERVSRAKLVDEVVVAYPGRETNKGQLIDVAYVSGLKGMQLHGYWGDENDLVGRYYFVANLMNAELVVRVCSDNPCIEPGEIDRLIEHFNLFPRIGCLWQNAQPWNQNGYPDGIGAEIYKFSILEKMNTEIENLTYREHLHQYFYDLEMVDGPQCPPEFARPDLRLDVNTQADLDYIRDIFAQFPDNAFHITEVIKYLNAKDVGMAV